MQPWVKTTIAINIPVTAKIPIRIVIRICVFFLGVGSHGAFWPKLIPVRELKGRAAHVRSKIHNVPDIYALFQVSISCWVHKRFGEGGADALVGCEDPV